MWPLYGAIGSGNAARLISRSWLVKTPRFLCCRRSVDLIGGGIAFFVSDHCVLLGMRRGLALSNPTMTTICSLWRRIGRRLIEWIAVLPAASSNLSAGIPKFKQEISKRVVRPHTKRRIGGIASRYVTQAVSTKNVCDRCGWVSSFRSKELRRPNPLKIGPIGLC